jgi:hypothetical protein
LNAEWVTITLLAVFVLLAVINVTSPRKWRVLTRSVLRMRLGRQTMREEIDLQDRTLLALLLLGFGVIGLFVWQFGTVRMGAGMPSYPWILAAVIGFALAQGLALRLMGFLLRVDHGAGEHLYTGLMLFVLAGLLLLPVVVLLAYQAAWRPQLLFVGGLIVGGMVLYRWVRGAWIGLGEGVPVRYIILYLCAAEILPVLLLVSVLRHRSLEILQP